MHTGEVELRDGDIGEIAVHIASRVMGLAQPNEVLVSSTVKDLVAGAEIRFEDSSVQSLREVPGQWPCSPRTPSLFLVLRKGSLSHRPAE